MGITVPDREGTPEGPPKTRPVVSVDTSQPLTQRASLSARVHKYDDVLLWTLAGIGGIVSPSMEERLCQERAHL